MFADGIANRHMSNNQNCMILTTALKEQKHGHSHCFSTIRHFALNKTIRSLCALSATNPGRAFTLYWGRDSLRFSEWMRYSYRCRRALILEIGIAAHSDCMGVFHMRHLAYIKWCCVKLLKVRNILGMRFTRCVKTWQSYMPGRISSV